MKNKIGYVKDYDGKIGNIVTEDNDIYLLLGNDIIDNITLTDGDLVSFVAEEFQVFDTKTKIARFIKKS